MLNKYGYYISPLNNIILYSKGQLEVYNIHLELFEIIILDSNLLSMLNNVHEFTFIEEF